MLDKQVKADAIQKFAAHDKDTGSSQVQISILTSRITQIAGHLKSFPKDKHSRHGLVKLVGKRRTLQKFLKRNDRAAYAAVMLYMKSLKKKS